jgi:hypothetical protein
MEFHMAGINSKNKGNTFERKIANLLSKRFEEKTGLKSAYKRNADSGSYFGGKNQQRIETHGTENANFGDIICPKSFAYSIECKHYKQAPSMSNIMQQNCKDWDLWIGQAEQDSKNSGKKMSIIIKYNNVEEIVILSEQVPLVYNMPYKHCFVVLLKDYLKQDDSVFFS